jgi:hypothetical protein
MPRCVVCGTTEGLELDKGRYKCPDHRGSLEEIESKIPFVDPFPEVAIMIETLEGRPHVHKDRNSDVIKASVTWDYVLKEKAKREARENSPRKIPSQADISRQEVKTRYH